MAGEADSRSPGAEPPGDGAGDVRPEAEALESAQPVEAPAGAENGWKGTSRPVVTPHQVTDRVTIWVARAVFFLVSVGLGLHGAHVLSLLSPDNPVPGFYGVVAACLIALLLIAVEALFARSPIRTIAAVTFGLLMGLVFSLIFQPVVSVITESVVPEELAESDLRALRAFLNLMTTSIFCYFGVTLLVETRGDFKFIIPFVEFRKEIKSRMPLVLDTSAFIDGRLQGLLTTDVFDQRLEVPRFVLDELQRVADSEDRSLRERGRRGLDILHRIERQFDLRVVDFPLLDGEEVDVGLLRLTGLQEGKLVTTDHNLEKRARVQGVKVINVNDIAAALKPSFVPGESLRLRIQRRGEEAGQGVGFLADGTMVVVEGAADNTGREVSVEVTSSLQTNAGKMVFGRLRKADKDGSRREGGRGRGRGQRQGPKPSERDSLGDAS